MAAEARGYCAVVLEFVEEPLNEVAHLVDPRAEDGFLDALVEGAERQKTPNEIALTILLSSLTLIFLLVCVTLQPKPSLRIPAASLAPTDR